MLSLQVTKLEYFLCRCPSLLHVPKLSSDLFILKRVAFLEVGVWVVLNKHVEQTAQFVVLDVGQVIVGKRSYEIGFSNKEHFFATHFLCDSVLLNHLRK